MPAVQRPWHVHRIPGRGRPDRVGYRGRKAANDRPGGGRMDHAHDADSDDDLDERLSRVFEERGIPRPPPRAAAPVAYTASVSKVDGPPARPPVASQTPQSAGKTAR